jgi:hypothetical protein
VLFSVVLSTKIIILLIGFISVHTSSLLFSFFFSSVSHSNAESNACAVKFFSVKRAIRVLISLSLGNDSFTLFVIRFVIFNCKSFMSLDHSRSLVYSSSGISSILLTISLILGILIFKSDFGFSHVQLYNLYSFLPLFICKTSSQLIFVFQFSML